MTPKTKKAERNAKREEFTRAALLYCSLHTNEDTVFQRQWSKAEQAMIKAYRAMEEK